MTDWSDRAIDLGLQELHGQRPPDLSARVLLALRESAPGPLPQLAPPRPFRRRTPWFAAAAALASVAAVAAWWLGTAPVPPPPLVQIAVQVTAGALAADQLAGPPPRHQLWQAGHGGDFAARPRNRLRCSQPTQWTFGAFGRLSAGPDTELEVETMEISVKQGAIAGAVLTVAVVAGVVTWHALDHDTTVHTGGVVRMEAQPAPGPDLAAENARLLQRIRDLEQAQEALLAARTAVPEQAPSADAKPEVAAAPVPAAVAVLFDDPRYAEALAKVDWALVGKVTDEMQPLLLELAAAMAKDGEVPPELAAKIGALNAQLVNQLPALLKAGLPGFGPNGAYTHPLFVGNSLASTLAAAGLPLDGNQTSTLANLVRSFSAENQALADQPQGLAVERLLAETTLKQRLYQELQSQLTPQQLARLYPEGSTRYDGLSMFSTGLMTRPYTQPLNAQNPADFARQASRRLGEELGLDAAGTDRARALFESIAGSTRELWSEPADSTESNLRMLRAGRTEAAMRAQLTILQELQRQVPLTPEQQKKLQQLSRIYVPLPR
ncbi:MAG: hypothetical protein JNK49_03470 [Planctomycetes bacterium]|nr:hypothetical protein [Planctomycetota bacterium]